MKGQEQEFRRKIREFVEANMNVDDDVELKDDDNIFGQGYVTSIFAMRLLNFTENLSGITIADEDIILPNFSSIDAIASLVRKYLGVIYP